MRLRLPQLDKHSGNQYTGGVMGIIDTRSRRDAAEGMASAFAAIARGMYGYLSDETRQIPEVADMLAVCEELGVESNIEAMKARMQLQSEVRSAQSALLT